ncbi:hypothetical protein [Flavobacterium reichenbachii]|uniref:Uncharacterized protein n=1 Tax=Flavobacterium reichenbachii TaxID=362418 RepID=A0A085ZFZ0_9FLAO|nr:hypothetical protein [Flavobacterium reichenbachii]KFF03354.1 hypothetical protein IW19_20925 [Flavobacterium reichenbachii]OXB16720.1 hypothetical protein B0A68_06215 [Flavobacterium reichenbachii]
MKTNTLSQEAETRLNDFFNNIIDPEDMAKILRQVNFILALGVMRKHEPLQIGVTNFEENYYFLNELAEILNPYFSEE